MYYLKNYFTDEIIATFNNIKQAIASGRKTADSEVITDTNETLYTNIELPF